MASSTNQPVSLGLGFKAKKLQAVSFYDFAVDGGAVGTLALRGDAIPTGAYVTSYKIVVDTAVTSGGAATAGLQWNAASDILAATVVSGAPWSTTGNKANASSVAVGDGTALDLVIAVAALTAGAFRVVTEYIIFAG